jgi:voltage-gated potassium channel
MTLEVWEKRAEIPLIIFSILFLISYSWQVLAGGECSTWGVLETINLVVWLIFVIDYVVRLSLASQRGQWFSKHLFDLVIVVLPALRPLRLLRLVTLLHVLNRTAGGAVRSQVLTFAIGSTVILLYIAALAVLEAERSEGAITTFGEALWWAIVTITTVGYGDYAPVTFMGRSVAVGLMIGGVVLVGVIVGTLSSWIVERVDASALDAQNQQQEELSLVRQEIAELKTLLEAKK